VSKLKNQFQIKKFTNMSESTLINATDLNLWANKNIASSTLPQFLRRLIITTVKGLNFISFAAGDGTLLGGWDGRLDVTEGNAFVPDGKSVWELGTNKGVKGKADDDYEKRKADSLGYTPSETTYIFVTPRRWGGKDSWVTERNAEGFWKEVRAYDADDLEAWLEMAPNIHIWFSILLGKHPESAIDISNYWSDWSGVTNPQLTSSLVISGRDEVTTEIYRHLQNPPSTLTLQADSKNEAVAFLASTLNLLPEEAREYYVAKCIVVETPTAWRRLITSETPLILVPVFNERDVVSNAARQGHHVIIPLGRADATASQTVIVPRLHRESAKQELINLGIASEKVDSLATLARRSFLALRRKMAIIPEVQCPTWATPAEARTILPILLAGKWIDSNPPDQEIIAKLARTSYEEVNKILSRWANESDSPVRRIGNTWFLVSKEDAWDLLAKFLTREDLNNFEGAFLPVFNDVDPSLELPIDDRWQANILGKVLSYSNYLREGLAETLAIMAARSDSTAWLDANTGQERANWIVWKLLDCANKNWQLWASLVGQLQLLAEAAPEIFLEAINRDLNGDQSLINLFSESEQSVLSSGARHSDLLWALELLAWHPNYLSHSALMLAKLARLDPGGKLANRPDRSLREIFLGWHPQTNANLEKRLQVIDLIRRREPEVAWKLMRSLLPEMHSAGFPTAKPQWREWNVNSAAPVTYAEIWELTKEIVYRMLEDVEVVGKRWSDLLSALGQLPKEQHEDIVNKLSSLDINLFLLEDRIIIWETLRGIISKHREYSDAKWAMPAEFIDNLEIIYHKFTPDDSVNKYSWLFTHGVKLINPPIRDPKNWQHKEEVINRIRVDALQEIYSHDGIPSIIKLVDQVKEPSMLGFILGKSDLAEKEEDVLLNEYLVTQENKLNLFALGYISGRFQRKEWDWAKSKLSSQAATWSAEQKANFLSCLSFNEQTWDLLESFKNPKIESSYWSRINAGYAPDIDIERVTRNLIKYNRPQIAVDFLAYYSHGEDVKIPPILAFEVLENLITATAELGIQWGDIGYDLSVLMSIVRSSNEIDESRIAQLEWYFFPLLEQYGEGPKLLHRELSQNPEFFVDLIRTIFRSENEELNEQISDSEARISLAFKLINSWHICPGENSDGTLDKEVLMNWVSEAHTELHNLGRGDIGDQQIGQALAESPQGADGVYPHEYVREVIDELSNQQIERGFEVRVFNNRGVTTRGLTDGGAQERLLAQRYLDDATKINDKYPRTAAMLKRIAEYYLGQAHREDANAELTEDFWR
jgi:hypothetical protein